MNVGCIVVTFALGKVDWQECGQIDVRRCDLCGPPTGAAGAGSWESRQSEESEESVKTPE